MDQLIPCSILPAKQSPYSTYMKYSDMHTDEFVTLTNEKGQGHANPHPLECVAPNEQLQKENIFSNIKYLVVGIAFGIVFVKAEIVSWFRIQEMFRLNSFHMYGVIGTAIITGVISVFLIKKLSIKTLQGEKVQFHPKTFNKGQIFGGVIFGLGWAITGACPGPLFAQIGAGFGVVTITLVSAIAGTWVYGLLRDKLPH